MSDDDQSKPLIDVDSRIQFPDSRCSSQSGSPFDSCLDFFFSPLVAIKKISLLHSKNLATLAHCAFKICHRLSFFSFFALPSSSCFPTKIKSTGAQARHFSTKLSLIFQRLLTLRTQLPADLQCVIRSGEECGGLCSGAIKRLPPPGSFVGKSDGRMFPRAQVRGGEHESRNIDERSPADDDTRQAKSMRNRTAAQRLACYAC